MSGSVSIRRLLPEDDELYRSIRLEGLATDPTAFTASLEVESTHPLEWFSDRLQRNLILGAFNEANLIGVIGLGENASPKTRHKAGIWGTYVRPAARGMGIGSLLMQAIMDNAPPHVELIQLGVVADNASALALYKKTGFIEYGFEKCAVKYEGRYYDESLMAKFIDKRIDQRPPLPAGV